MSNQKNSPDKTFFIDGKVLIGFRQLSVKDIILSLLKERNWKQTDLAREVGLSKSALNNYISGRFATPTQIKIKIAQVLGVDSSVIWDLK